MAKFVMGRVMRALDDDPNGPCIMDPFPTLFDSEEAAKQAMDAVSAIMELCGRPVTLGVARADSVLGSIRPDGTDFQPLGDTPKH